MTLYSTGMYGAIFQVGLGPKMSFYLRRLTVETAPAGENCNG